MPGLFAVPAPQPLEGAALEDAARVEMMRALGWRATLRAPSWGRVVFRGQTIRVMLPKVPDEVVERIARLEPTAFAPDEIGVLALKLAEGLKMSLPEGAAPLTMAPVRRFPPARDLMATWNRRAVLTGIGPEIAPLLVAGGYLLPDDVSLFEETYPDGFEEQRAAAAGALQGVAAAGRRARTNDVMPPWLDDQFWTLIGEPRDTQTYQGLYEPDKKQQPQSPPQPPGGESKIAEQFRPTPSPGSVA